MKVITFKLGGCEGTCKVLEKLDGGRFLCKVENGGGVYRKGTRVFLYESELGKDIR